ncbi:GntR family transcriptional regulator [Streptomyces sp. H27-C3]|uniref:GntR family transcriptional regulator n=1 Tax=Streptomyces sp. H27-C3 TaxID=3046305 RepID=UPI0024BB002C|nr:GntR family transcriptional regulator [Streptomyces sp. H27-C3]MDJ0465023.1 GntR family transcriptional regulator [Streptomyces sp. H27-C3]
MTGQQPQGAYLTIADQLRQEIRNRPAMTDLPRISDLMAEHAVSRSTVRRALAVLHQEGLAEPLPGGRWNVRP